MEKLKIWLLCIAAAVAYGITQDQFTARVCVEYFTIGHPPVFHTSDPALLALGWGTIASWWVGAMLGIPLAFAAQAGPRPRLSARDLLRPLIVLLACMGLAAFVAGECGYSAGPGAAMYLPPGLPLAKIQPFVADSCAHLAAYSVGFLGGLALCVWATLRRSRLAAHSG